jgi:hypothetical protein
MKTKTRLFVAAITLLFASTFVHAAIVPLSVYPNPVQFGTVAESSTSSITLYITNVTSNPAVVTAMSITGVNASAFALPSNSCITTIAPNAICTTNVTFTPSAIGVMNANLAITVLGDSTAINISLEGTGGAPLPVLSSISPTGVYINSAAFTLTVNGTGFAPGDVIDFGYNNALTTTYVSSTQLTALVAASYLTFTQTYPVYVSTTTAQSSNQINFSVVALAPGLQSISPNFVVEGSTPASITVNGYNFMNGATVQWNGKSLSGRTARLSPQPSPAPHSFNSPPPRPILPAPPSSLSPSPIPLPAPSRHR